MEITTVVERAQRVAAVRADAGAGRGDIEAALRDTTALRSWLSSGEAALAAKLAAFDSFPEKTVGDCTRGSTRDGAKIKERSDTLDKSPEMADALDDGSVTEAHVDALTNAAKQLEEDQRAELFDRVGDLVDVAAVANLAEWRRRLAMEAKNIQRDDGIAKLERQKRATRLRGWVDGDGMVCLTGRFDPITGHKLLARLDQATAALFAESVPETCPTDPVEKQRHLQALALARLVDAESGSGGGGRAGRPEYIVVIDTSQSDGAGGPQVDWGLPIEVPYRVLADMAGGGTVHPVVVRNGVVIHAPGQLDLGRTTRLANRAQRRTLRALYSTCAIPGCTVKYDRCKLHHVIWWRNGGGTDLDNLLPVCTHHHTKIHDAGWTVALGPNRQLTVTFPDGTVRNTGPPTRAAA